MIRLRGGAKKRKKKNYTTPKKIKHKHRKVKLAVLKYYKVRLENESYWFLTSCNAKFRLTTMARSTVCAVSALLRSAVLESSWLLTSTVR